MEGFYRVGMVDVAIVVVLKRGVHFLVCVAGGW